MRRIILTKPDVVRSNFFRRGLIPIETKKRNLCGSQNFFLKRVFLLLPRKVSAVAAVIVAVAAAVVAVVRNGTVIVLEG